MYLDSTQELEAKSAFGNCTRTYPENLAIDERKKLVKVETNEVNSMSSKIDVYYANMQ